MSLSPKALANLAEAVAAAGPDFDKALAGNKAATTRVRKAMMAIRIAAQDIRKGIADSVEAATKVATKATAK